MSKQDKKNTAELVREAAEPVASSLDLTLWDVEFQKEGPGWVLRIYIDKPEGISLDDCEKFSRAFDPILDDLDPTEKEYMFEVSSPGLSRNLRTDRHIESYIQKNIYLKLIRPSEDNEREFKGILESYDDGIITVLVGEKKLSFKKKDTAVIKAYDDEI